MRKTAVRVAVIGGGIIGMSTALNAVESIRDLVVTVIAEKVSPHTTGDVSAGFWNPYSLGDVPIDTLRYWCSETFGYLLSLVNSEQASTCGVGLLSAYHLSKDYVEDPPYSDIFLHYRDITDKELSMFSNEYRFGKFYTTVYAECSKLLPYMMKKFKAKGGKIIKKKVNHLTELVGQYDVIINCSGVQAAHIVPDPNVYPIRGQTIRVYAPWIKHAVTTANFHILPNSEWVVCGGTHQKDNWNTNVDPIDRESIWRGCCEIVPSLKKAKIVKELVGLRPGRFKPRMEREVFNNEIAQTLEVIHNYGHGGSGVTLFWGCAKDAVKLLQESVARIQKSHLTSNL